MSRRRERAPERPSRGRTAAAPSGAPAWAPYFEFQLALVAIVLFGVAVAAVAFGPHKLGDYATETDFYGAYADGARALQHGHLDPSRYGVVGPVYELTLAGVGLVVRDLFSAAEVISLLASVVTLLVWLLLLRRVAPQGVAVVATLLLAANPQMFRYGYTASTDALAMALQALALFALLATESRRSWVIAGALAALALLTRYSAAYLVPVGLLVAWHRGRSRAALGFAAGVLVPVGTWLAISLAHGAAPGGSLHHNIAYEIYAHARGLSWDEYQRTLQPTFHSLGDVLARDPGAVARRIAFNLFDHLRQDASLLLGWPVAVCVVLGVVTLLAERLAPKAWPLWVAGGLLYLTLVPVFYSERYALPLLPVYAALAAAPFASPWLGARLGRYGAALLLLLAALPVGLSLAASVRLQRAVLAQQPVEILEAADTLRRLARPGDAVIARKPHLAFHAGVTAVPFPPSDSLAAIAEQARRTNARWLYISWAEAMLRPGTQFLLDSTAAVPGLTPRAVTHPRPSVLYEIGPGFGVLPGWITNDTLRTLHRARVQLAVYPRDVRALTTAAYIEATRGELAAATAHIENASAEAPGDPEVQLLRGQIALRRGDAATAARAFETVTRLAPGSESARIAGELLERMQGTR